MVSTAVVTMTNEQLAKAINAAEDSAALETAFNDGCFVGRP